MRRSDAKGQELRLGPGRVDLAGARVGELWRSRRRMGRCPIGVDGGRLCSHAAGGNHMAAMTVQRGAVHPWPPYVCDVQQQLGADAEGRGAASCRLQLPCRAARQRLAMSLRSDSGEVI